MKNNLLNGMKCAPKKIIRFSRYQVNFQITHEFIFHYCASYHLIRYQRIYKRRCVAHQVLCNDCECLCLCSCASTWFVAYVVHIRQCAFNSTRNLHAKQKFKRKSPNSQLHKKHTREIKMHQVLLVADQC